MTQELVVRTFLFTDIEGSTRTWQTAPDEMARAVSEHDAILRGAVAAHGGVVFKGTGDGVLAVFDSPRPAVAAAVDAQRALLDALPFRVRTVIATGEAHERDGDWFGPALNRCARLLEAGHGGQILLSAAAASLLRDLPIPDLDCVSLGEHRLRDLPEPQPIFQVVVPGLPSEHPALRVAPEAPLHNIPSTRTRLVGRERELDELSDVLSETRLLTVTGVGGVGKTRLAVELARRTLDRFPGGTFFAELASVGNGSLVARTVADACGLETGGIGAGTDEDHLLSFLRDRRSLVVLDNCEHLLDDCAELCDSLLDRCPHVTVVATSREPLAVEGEQVWRVPSLTVEGDDAEAVSLFVDRAGSVRRETHAAFDLTVVSEICRRLDGIPLAIELAAAQTAHLAVADIASRLTSRFSLLTGGRRRVQRQQTLLAAVEWSHGLLSEEERVPSARRVPGSIRTGGSRAGLRRGFDPSGGRVVAIAGRQVAGGDGRRRDRTVPASRDAAVVRRGPARRSGRGRRHSQPALRLGVRRRRASRALHLRGGGHGRRHRRRSAGGAGVGGAAQRHGAGIQGGQQREWLLAPRRPVRRGTRLE